MILPILIVFPFSPSVIRLSKNYHVVLLSRGQYEQVRVGARSLPFVRGQGWPGGVEDIAGSFPHFGARCYLHWRITTTLSIAPLGITLSPFSNPHTNPNTGNNQHKTPSWDADDAKRTKNIPTSSYCPMATVNGGEGRCQVFAICKGPGLAWWC